SSGSSSEASSVDAVRSANRTVTTLRSSTWRSSAGLAGGAGETVASNAAPQFPQKRKPGGLVAPHTRHVALSALPHDPQKRNPAGFAVPHVGQVVSTPLPTSVTSWLLHVPRWAARSASIVRPRGSGCQADRTGTIAARLGLA